MVLLLGTLSTWCNLTLSTSTPKCRISFFFFCNLCWFGYQGVAQFGSVSVLGTEGRRFESCHPDAMEVFFSFLSCEKENLPGLFFYDKIKTSNKRK